MHTNLILWFNPLIYSGILVIKLFKPGAHQPRRMPGFLKLLLSGKFVCVCVCVCVCPRPPGYEKLFT